MFELIPAIDVVGGRCVRIGLGDVSKQGIFNDDPLTLAQNLEGIGIRCIYIIDMNGALQRFPQNLKVVQAISEKTNVKIMFGGGLQSVSAVQSAVNAGADQIMLGSLAVNNRALVLDILAMFGKERVVLGADAKSRQINPETNQEHSCHVVEEFIGAYHKEGIEYAVCTDIDRDGIRKGPAFEHYRNIMRAVPGIKLIASGGIGSISDLEHLRSLKLYGALLGKAFYSGQIPLEDLVKFSHSIS